MEGMGGGGIDQADLLRGVGFVESVVSEHQARQLKPCFPPGFGNMSTATHMTTGAGSPVPLRSKAGSSLCQSSRLALQTGVWFFAKD